MKSRPVPHVILAALLGLLVFSLTGGAAAQGIQYDNQGKRDPFLNLLQINQKPEPARIVGPPPLDQRPPGLAGLLVAEVSLTGVAAGSGSVIALLKGIDGVSYFAREGTKLFDGYVESVSEEEIVFVREQVDTRGNKRVTRVRKQIQTEER